MTNKEIPIESKSFYEDEMPEEQISGIPPTPVGPTLYSRDWKPSYIIREKTVYELHREELWRQIITKGLVRTIQP